MVEIVVVNASNVLTDAEVTAVIPAIQKWDDSLLRPAWGFDPCTYSFATWHDFQQRPVDPNRWPLFLNRHSTDPGALGWHDDQSGMIFGRVFVGDCLRYGVSWTVDLTHEAAEMRGDPTIDKTATLPDGRLALVELCDPVEDDLYAIEIDGVKLSDFVLPSYFSAGAAPYDHRGILRGPCPTLASGGYQSIFDRGNWTQVTAMGLGGPPSYRSQRYHRGHRLPRILPPS